VSQRLFTDPIIAIGVIALGQLATKPIAQDQQQRFDLTQFSMMCCGGYGGRLSPIPVWGGFELVSDFASSSITRWLDRDAMH
jgi:hypothetical protein